jgi:hypothetical protein
MNFKITKREIIASISIIAILLMIGFAISGRISEKRLDDLQKYNTALKIEDTDLFEYAMDTNAGNAFVYGNLTAIDTVSYPDIKGQYMYVEKVTEKYRRHTRTVTKTKTVNGKTKTYTDTEVYWSWDRVDSEDKMCKNVNFCGVTFKSSLFSIPSAAYIDTVSGGYHIRYKFYGCNSEYTGTIFAKLADNTISSENGKINFYNNHNIEETIEALESFNLNILFWIFWIILMGACVFGFYYIDNRWLE